MGTNGAEGQTRTVDTGIFSAVLYHLSYLGSSVYYQIWARGLSRRKHLPQPLSNGGWRRFRT